jgi:diguanylate cyclase (GGDEF)-like protein
MDQPAQLLDQARLENRVMAEMAALAAGNAEYTDAVHAVLDLVEQVVSSPLLSLSIQERGQVGHYSRIGDGVDLLWAREAEQFLAETREQRVAAAVTASRATQHHLPSPPAWFVGFPAGSRSGRASSLILGAPQPLAVMPEEAQLMLRLSRQVLLVLEHAILLREIEDMERRDRLTGVATHRRLLGALGYEIKRHRHSGGRLALLLLDVEGLSAINRSYGRSYGNHILRRIADLLLEIVRPIDMVARSGQDEFAVVLPETDEEEAQDLAERLRERLLGVEFAGGAVSLSVGVAQVKPDESLTPEQFLRRAEQALYESKRQDRERTALWKAGTRR